ncbi:MAG TPA: hypothetical protein VD948_03155 [Rhodothermales bacterium]|nr:hypothetical protein [Rhodothermales bacterium]
MAPAPALPASSSRIGPLDTFRCLTVTLALLSHALLEFRVDTVTSADLWLTMRSITRSATPGLLLLFGVMAEVVHFRRYVEDRATLRRRLVRRLAQCYVTFVVLAALVMVCRPEPASYLLRSFAFLTLEGYNVIFALYFFLLLALFGLLPLHRRWGFWGLGVAVGVVWGLDALVVSKVPPAAETLKALGDMTLGTGGAWGPSAFHSVSLVIVGMAFGNVLYARERTPGSRAVAAVLVLTSAGLIAAEMLRVGAAGFFRGIVDLATYRAHNHPAYYAYGMMAAVVTIPLAYALDAGAPDVLRRRLHALGSRTFSYFVVGNALLILMPEYGVGSAAEAVGLIGLYLALSAAATLLWAGIARTPHVRRLLRGRRGAPTPVT